MTPMQTYTLGWTDSPIRRMEYPIPHAMLLAAPTPSAAMLAAQVQMSARSPGSCSTDVWWGAFKGDLTDRATQVHVT